MTDKNNDLYYYSYWLCLEAASFTDKAAERREMIQTVESQKMKVAIKPIFKNLDPFILTPNGK